MITINIKTQPNDITCGPTSLQAVYKFYGDNISLERVIEEVEYLASGGTLEVLLGIHALKRGYQAVIYSYNLKLLDPSWINKKNEELIENLNSQVRYKDIDQLKEATEAYIEFLKIGGKILQSDLTTQLLKKYFSHDIPIIAGLSSTYLYNSKREYSSKKNQIVYDDLKGFPTGHFVVLCGYDEEKKHIVIADPYKENPLSGNNYYSVNAQRLINSIMLGIVTYDASLLIIHPKEK